MMIDAAAFHRSKHLSDQELNPQDDMGRCKFCNSDQVIPIWKLQSAPGVNLLQCASCLAVSPSRLPITEALSEYYHGYYDRASCGEKSVESQITFHDPNRLATKIRKYIDGEYIDELKILDFGGGDGTISYLLANQLLKQKIAREISITIVDFTEKVVVTTDSRIKIAKENMIDSNADSSYSIVIASAVIEHYPNAGELLDNLLKCVSHGGLFYARTPNMVPLMKLFRRIGVNIDFTFPGHLYDLGEGFWSRIFERRDNEFKLLLSEPSIVETSFRQDFIRTTLAYLLKMPWYIIGRKYQLVGGWQVIARKY